MIPYDGLSSTQGRTGFQAKYVKPLYGKPLINRLDQFPENKPDTKEERGPPEQSEKQKNEQKLDELCEGSLHPILRIKQAIPFNPFPDEVIIDMNKVSIIYRQFFSSEQLHSVLIRDVSDVLVETSIIFSVLKIVDIGYTENFIDVNYLKTKDANKARRIIQGLVVAHRYGVDLAKIGSEELEKKVEQLGTISD